MVGSEQVEKVMSMVRCVKVLEMVSVVGMMKAAATMSMEMEEQAGDEEGGRDKQSGER